MSSRHARQLLAVAVGFSVLFAWVWAYAAAHGGYLAESDLYEEYLPTFLAPATWWSSFEFGGAPVFAAPSESLWYFPHVLFKDIVGSLTAYVASANVIAACGAYLCLLNLTRSRVAALFAGVAYGLSEAMMERASHLATMHAVAWLPWVVLSIDRLRGPRSWPWVALSALAVANFLLAGNPQTFLYGAYACLAYALVGAVAERASWRFYAAGAAAVGLGALLTAVATLPMLELSLFTARQRINFAQFAGGAMSPAQVLSALFPTILHDGRGTPTYVGLLTLIFAVASLRRAGSEWRVAFWWIVAALALLVAVGDLTPVARLAFELPFYDRFRIGVRHLYLTAFGLTLLAGLSIGWLRDRRVSPAAIAGAAAVVLAALAGGAWATARWPSAFEYDDVMALSWTPPGLQPIIWLQLAIGIVSAGLAVAFAYARSSRVIPAVMIAVLAGDLIYALPYDVTPLGVETVTLPRDAAERPSVHAARLAGALAPAQQRLLSASGTQVDDVVPAAFARLWRIPIAGGYNSMMLASYNRTALMENNGAVERPIFADQDAALDLLATRFVLVHEEDLSPSETMALHGTTWTAERLDLPVGPPECRTGSMAGTAVGLPAAVPVRTIMVAAHLSCADAVPQGTPVATLRVAGASGVVVERELRAGIDVAEAGLKDEAFRRRARHAPAAIFDAEESSYSYLIRIDLPAPVAGARLEMVLNGTPGPLVLDRLTAIDADGRAFPQTLTSLLLANTTRWTEAARFATSRQTDRDHDETASDEHPYVVFENRRARPRAWLVRSTIALTERELETAVHYSLLPDGQPFDPATTAVLEAPAPGATTYRAGESSVTVRPVEDARITVDVTTTTPGFLVLSENIYPGWEADVSGTPTPVRRTDGTLQGVEVPAGTHVVTFTLRPRSLRLGGAISAAALLAVGAIGWWSRPRRSPASRRARAGAPADTRPATAPR